jgi:glucokinase
MNRYLAIDLGGTSIKYGVFEEKGLIHKFSRPTHVELGPQYIVNSILEAIGDVIVNNEIKAIGIGVPGIVSYDMKTIYDCKNLGWVDVKLYDAIYEKFGIESFIDNDANAALLAEVNVGALKGVKNGIILTLGTGVGGGALVEGKILRGHSGISFEVGHMVITDRDYLCNCGRRGCFETVASATGFVRLYNEISLTKVIGTKEIFDEYKLGSNIALNVVNEYCTYLAKGMGNLINLFDPEKIVLGGGVAKSFDLFYPTLMEKLEEERFSPRIPLPRVEYSKLGEDTGIIGARYLIDEKA